MFNDAKPGLKNKRSRMNAKLADMLVGNSNDQQSRIDPIVNSTRPPIPNNKFHNNIRTRNAERQLNIKQKVCIPSILYF